MNVVRNAPSRSMTIAEFLEWAAATDGRWQLRDGEPEPMDAASNRHGGILAELSYMLIAHLRRIESPFRVVIAPGVVPSQRPERNMLVPDLAISSARLTPARGLNDCAVLIEILSPSNERQTRANVRAYMTIQSVLEIVVVSGMAIGAEIIRRLPDGNWPAQPDIVRGDGRLTIRSIGLDVQLLDAYRTTDLAG